MLGQVVVQAVESVGRIGEEHSLGGGVIKYLSHGMYRCFNATVLTAARTTAIYVSFDDDEFSYGPGLDVTRSGVVNSRDIKYVSNVETCRRQLS